VRILIIHRPVSERSESTITDCLRSFKTYSKNSIEYVSTTDFFTKENNLNVYDCLCLYKFHFSKEASLSLSQKLKIREYPGIKAIFLEEEYFLIDERVENIKFMDINLIFSPLPSRVIPKIYKNLYRERKIIKVFNGYIDDSLLGIKLKAYEKRPIDIAYRALNLPAFYGRLGQEKNHIGTLFLEHAKEYGLSTDISNDFSRRFLGEKWRSFLCSSKAVLGVEGHSGVVDFNKKIYDSAIEYERKNPLASFEKIERIFFNGLDGIYNTRSITPRHFEYAACRCLMFLYEGEYEGCLEPYKHYLPIQKDFSNIRDVISAFKNPIKAEEIINNAYKDIALNHTYHFKEYVAIFDRELDFYHREGFASLQNDTLEIKGSFKIGSSDLCSQKTVYNLIKDFFVTYLGTENSSYRFLQYCANAIKNTIQLWRIIKETSRSVWGAAIWFIFFLPRKNEGVFLLNILKHMKERESFFKANIVCIKNNSAYCEVHSTYPGDFLISFREFILLITELKQTYLLFNLSSAWHLKDEFRSDCIVKVNLMVYKFIEKYV